MTPGKTIPSLQWRWVFIALLVLFVLLLLGGIRLYQSEGEQQRQRVSQQLQAISELKVRQITEWRNERTADGQVIAENLWLIAAADDFLQSKTDAAALQRQMQSLKENYHYREILLLDAGGKLRLSQQARNPDFSDSVFLGLELAHQSHRAIQTDLHIDPENGIAHGDVIVPLQIGQGNSARRVGTLLLQIDPTISLLPKLNTWPQPTKTAETLLTRRDGDQLIFLSELHQRSGTAFRSHSSDLWQNTGGASQVVEGIDYEGMPVLASIQPIPDTAWYIIAKIGQDEALAGWHHASRLIIALTGGLLLTVLIAGAFIYQTRGLLRYRSLFETEAARRAEHLRFQAAFHANPLCASITRLSDGRIIDANDNFLRNFGRSRADMIGRTSLEIGLWPDPETRQTLLALLAREARVVNHESIWIDRHGGTHHVEISASLIDITGETHILAFTADVTERRLAQSELAQYRRRLEAMVDERTYELAIAKEHAERASRTKSAFLANMSHEIRTPLNAVIGLTHLMQLDTQEPRQTERLGRITDAAHHLLGVINDILDISKIEANKLELEESDFSIAKMLDETLKMVEFKARDKGLSLLTEISPGLPSGLHGDPLRLQQILLNFLTNAVKFTERGHIRLSACVVACQDKQVQLRFEVEDTGIGISALALPRLFRPFEQADGSTTRHFGGTGLGLAISRKLALKMGGDTGVTSTPGEGSTFWVTVRLALAKQAISNEPGTAPDDKRDEASLLVRQLAAIAGFDTVVGLASLSGKADKYITLLEHYLKHHTEIGPRIGHLLHQADYQAARHEAHTLKGACAALGLSDTRQAAAELELALRRTAPAEELAALLAKLDETHNRQRRQLAEVLKQVPATTQLAASDPSLLAPLLHHLEALLAEDDIRSIEVARQGEALLRPLLGDDYPKLLEQLETFDFPAALQRLKQHLAASPKRPAEDKTWH